MLDLHERPATAGWPGADRRSPDYVYWLQQALGHLLGIALPPDGVFDARTRQALRAFQRRHGLRADGVSGPRVEAALMAAGAPPPPLDAPREPDLVERRLAADAPGADVPPTSAATRDRRNPAYVRWAQRALNRLIGARLVENGVVDLPTLAAVRVFQARHGLVADGVLGPHTEAALVAAGVLPLAGTEPSDAGDTPSMSTVGDLAPSAAPPDAGDALSLCTDLAAAFPMPPPDASDKCVDAVAADALRRLADEPGSSEPAAALLAALAAGRLGGIYPDNAPLPARVADELHVARWALVPSGQDATLTRDPTPGAVPIVVFRADVRADRRRLGAALLAACRALALLESGRLLLALPLAAPWCAASAVTRDDGVTSFAVPPQEEEPDSVARLAVVDDPAGDVVGEAAAAAYDLWAGSASVSAAQVAPQRAAGVWICPDDSRDRKSTRLNSSHI